MGTLRGDNGGGRPPDGGGLPDLPPEWGVVVIPDDLTELDDEAGAIRRDFRREARRNRWRRRFGRPPVYRASPDDPPALGLPLLIMSIAIIATLTSLFAIVWPAAHRPVQPSVHPTTAVSALPDITLTDPTGAPFRLRESLPAVILIVDDCVCAELIVQTATAASAVVSIVVVGSSVPALPGGIPAGREVTTAADPQNALHAAYPTHAVTAILANATGRVIVVAPVVSIEAFRGYLDGLS